MCRWLFFLFFDNFSLEKQFMSDMTDKLKLVRMQSETYWIADFLKRRGPGSLIAEKASCFCQKHKCDVKSMSM